MNLTFQNILNGIATTAKNTGDTETVSVCQHIMQIAEWSFGNAYDSSTAVASPLVIRIPNVNAIDVNTSFDSITGQGTDIRVNGG